MTEHIVAKDIEEFEASLPRSMEGEGLRIVSLTEDGITISDGMRAAVYVPHEGVPPLTGDLQIVPSYTEAGYFMEANCVRITNGERTILYVPDRIVGRLVDQ